ncbi:hypothetical protein [Arthrobacter sp.]|uniref:hypothetical protein n=1 Tax=Arthrobacter sp. TaxID=1667 RepID=UPI0026DFD214|nr:hypothetical protein [Arthrobacter sp.]MDO5752452.1 hypothetical protein [Arthrobacter sp.]
MTQQSTNPWVKAAQNLTPAPAPQAPAPVAPREVPVFLAAHGGAGATSWAHILGGVDGGLVTGLNQEAPAPGAELVLVARASLDGIDAAKSAIAIHGYDRFACVLLVPSSPTRMPRLIANEVKVLSGAITVIDTPWTPGLLMRRAAQLTPTDISPKELHKITASLSQVGVTIEGETP